MPPFYCDHGHPIHLGEGVFINANCTFLDGGGITIGAHTLIGPNCQLYTPQHPMDYRERRKPIEVGRPITIGEDCWLGGGVIVCPGVRIGARLIIAAGSVVVHDIPERFARGGKSRRRESNASEDRPVLRRPPNGQTKTNRTKAWKRNRQQIR